ncbi:DUF1534 domain-containing protein [Pseudomonas syringae pv. tomato]|nr:DUF1534 domain-containing protein [Pseudomonas syringae pv. tomato]
MRLSLRTLQRGNAVRDALRHKRGRAASRTACRREAPYDSGEQCVVFRLRAVCAPSRI